MMDALVDREARALREENQKLRDRIEELEGCLFAGVREGVRVFGLKPIQSRMLALIATRGMATREAILASIYGGSADEPPDIKILDVHMCHIRKKIAAAGISVETVWGQGFRVTSENRRAIKEAIARELSVVDA